MAAIQFIKTPITNTEPNDIISPYVNASDFAILPEGMGLPIVLFITRSISASYHIFNTPEAPAPIAIQQIEITARNG